MEYKTKEGKNKFDLKSMLVDACTRGKTKELKRLVGAAIDNKSIRFVYRGQEIQDTEAVMDAVKEYMENHPIDKVPIFNIDSCPEQD